MEIMRAVAEELKAVKQEWKQMKQPPPPCLDIAPSVQCPGPARDSAAATQKKRPWPGDAPASTSPSLDSLLSSPKLPRTQTRGLFLPTTSITSTEVAAEAAGLGRPVETPSAKAECSQKWGPEPAWLGQPGGLREAALMSTPPFYLRSGSNSSRSGRPRQDAIP